MDPPRGPDELVDVLGSVLFAQLVPNVDDFDAVPRVLADGSEALAEAILTVLLEVSACSGIDR
ncbi:hypothetical protein [Halolamina salifodinae]|uniref:Uncharacterized protein n=1 Tax=Halolamina salifodinae TaxID=1202767 RepID=A0A8T4GS61_9EURY|nr:hypothetical protein [Halolamina salifodinae]MBP1985971.1 hypothetical protein [Halolamina salifodinae]